MLQFPLVVNVPADYATAKLLFQPKYKACVLKIELAVAFTGEIVHASFPHLGTTHDVRVWRNTAAQHPLYPGEIVMGDPAYVGADQVLVKHKRPKNGSLTATQKVTNRVIDGYRSRVEHIIGKQQHNYPPRTRSNPT